MKTKSEEIFESFLAQNQLAFTKIEEDKSSRPDYLVRIDNFELVFEVKELAEDENFGIIKDTSRPDIRSNARTIGNHVRNRIDGSRKQIQYGANQGIPSILLIYNNLDPLQMFGTDDMDFNAAMYGEPTLLMDPSTRETSELFNGRNQALQEKKNTSFSAVGRLKLESLGNPTLTLFENVFAKVKVPYERLPPCFEVKRVEISREPLSFARREEVLLPASDRINMDAIRKWCARLGIVSGACAAIFWLWSALVPVPKIEVVWDADTKPFVLALKKQSDLSAVAAIGTCLSVLCQALAQAKSNRSPAM